MTDAIRERLGSCCTGVVHDVMRAMGLGNFILPYEIRPLMPEKTLIDESVLVISDNRDQFHSLNAHDFNDESSPRRPLIPSITIMPNGRIIQDICSADRPGLADLPESRCVQRVKGSTVCAVAMKPYPRA